MSEPLTDADLDPLLQAEQEEQPPRRRRRRREPSLSFDEPVEAPKPPRQRQPRGELNRLRRELTKSATALSLIPFMATGTADRLADPRITAIIQQKAEAFADSWIAVAEVSPFVKENLARALSGGVWIHAGIQTAALGYSVAVFAGVVPLHPGAMMFMPEMGQFVYQQQPPGNGSVAAEDVPPPTTTPADGA